MISRAWRTIPGSLSCCIPRGLRSSVNSAKISISSPDRVFQCRLQLQTIILLLETSLEFAAHRIGTFTSHGANCGNETVSGAQSAHHQIQPFRQTLLKRVKTLGALME